MSSFTQDLDDCEITSAQFETVLATPEEQKFFAMIIENLSQGVPLKRMRQELQPASRVNEVRCVTQLQETLHVQSAPFQNQLTQTVPCSAHEIEPRLRQRENNTALHL